jgi:hypothetical protein
VGADIDGEAAMDSSAYSVSMSSDGTRVAIGALGTTALAHLTPATCACTRRAAGRGPRWAPTSTARLRDDTPGTRYRCPRTARAWRSAHRERRQPTPATCGCTRRAAGRGPRWGRHRRRGCDRQLADRRYRCPRTARAWRSAPLRTTARAAPTLTPVTCACTLLFATHPPRPPTASWAHAPTPWPVGPPASPRATRATPSPGRARAPRAR